MTTHVRGRTLRSRLLAYITSGIGRLQAAWRILINAQTTLLNTLARTRPARSSGSQGRARAAIAAFNTALAVFNRAAMGFAESWAASDLALIYREGAWTMLDNADRANTLFTWTGRHQSAITALSAQYYADLTRRIQEALRRARAFLRAAQDASNASLRGTFDIAALRRDHPLDTVVYDKNSHHPVDAWAQATVTWQAISTANIGAARTALDELAVDFVEVRDGADCGWTEHNDPDRADRTLRTVADALAHPAAHPNCQRELLPRLDLRGRTNILSGAPL